MNCLDLMVEEHRNAKRMLVVIRKYCYKVLKGEQVQYDDLFRMIDFVRNYVDRHHHGKEESMLFNKMTDELGPTADKLVRHGMLVEHDLGRLHMQELEAALNRVFRGDDEARLDIIANAIGYTQLLTRHIDKEDGVVYKYAARNLSKESLDTLNQECEKYEKEMAELSIQQKYLDLLSELEAKYEA